MQLQIGQNIILKEWIWKSIPFPTSGLSPIDSE